MITVSLTSPVKTRTAVHAIAKVREVKKVLYDHLLCFLWKHDPSEMEHLLLFYLFFFLLRSTMILLKSHQVSPVKTRATVWAIAAERTEEVIKV